MSGSCRLCHELIFSPPVVVVGELQPLHEYLVLVDVMRAHLLARHTRELQMLNMAVHDLVLFLSGLLLSNSLAEFAVQQSKHRQRLLSAVENASLTVVIERPAADERVLPGGEPFGVLKQ